VYISARSDYAVRAMLSVAAAPDGLVKASALAQTQDIPLSFLQGILLDLRRAGLLYSHRGMDGGYALARPSSEISVGDVLRAMAGSLTTIRGLPADVTSYAGVATGLRDVWLAVNDAIGDVVDSTSLGDLLAQPSGSTAPVA